MEYLSVMKELNTLLIIEELSKVIDCLPTGKAPVLVDILFRDLRVCKEHLVPPIQISLLLLERIYATGLEKLNIATLYKIKGTEVILISRGISLLSTLAISAFRSEYSSINVIFSFQQLQKNAESKDNLCASRLLTL